MSLYNVWLLVNAVKEGDGNEAIYEDGIRNIYDSIRISLSVVSV